MIDLNASFLFQIILFWVVMLILNNMLFKPMLSYLDYRKSLMEGRKAKVAEIEQDLEAKERYYNEKLAEAKEKGFEYKKGIREDVLKAQKEKVDAEQKILEDDMKKQKNLLISDMEKAKAEIGVLSNELGKLMAEKVLGRRV